MKIKKDIIKIPKEEYDNSISNFVSKSREISFIKSVYLFGKIGFPGISDIDLFVVVSEGNFEKKKKIILDEINKSSKYSKYLYYHDPLIVTEKEAPYAKFFHTTKNLKLLYGKRILFKKVENKFIYSLWNTFFYRTYLNEAKKGFSSERRILLILNNLAESIRYNLNKKRGEEFKKRVREVRERVLKGEDASKQEENLLSKGSFLIKKSELEKQKNKNINSREIIWDKRRSIFISSNQIKLIDLKLIKIYLFPKYYFEEREKYKKEILRFIKDNNLEKREFFTMRERFQSPSFFGC
jgi:hypothetical protein